MKQVKMAKTAVSSMAMKARVCKKRQLGENSYQPDPKMDSQSNNESFCSASVRVYVASILKFLPQSTLMTLASCKPKVHNSFLWSVWIWNIAIEGHTYKCTFPSPDGSSQLKLNSRLTCFMQHGVHSLLSLVTPCAIYVQISSNRKAGKNGSAAKLLKAVHYS